MSVFRGIDIYEDGTGGLFLHRDGDRYLVFLGHDCAPGQAVNDCAAFGEWAGTRAEAGSNGWEAYAWSPVLLDGWGSPDHIARYDDRGLIVLSTPGHSGRAYLGLPDRD
jgi:hypothetical protein